MATDTALSREQLLARIDDLGPRFRDRSSRYDREAAFPYESYDDLRDAGLLGVCIPARHGGLGASFADYMHLSARLGEYCAMTALTFNMHCQTVLWTGIVADELDLSPADRARHEEIRADLYRRILDAGEIMSQPLSEGVARGATAGVMTEAVPVQGGWRVSGRKIFASLSGAASAYNLTVKVPGEEQVRFMSVRADNPGVRIAGDWDTLGMRGTDSRTLLFEDAFVPHADELLPAGVYDQLAERWPYVYMTLTPTYLGLTRAVVAFVREYLGGGGSRRDVPQKQAGWAEIQIAHERAEALWQRVVAEAGIDPTPDQLRRAWAASFTVMETAPEVASKAIRVCGGGSIMRTLPLEQHYRDARCGSLMLPWSAEVCLERLGRFGLYDDEG
ncbi:acyl-CoA dehydrogenase family protein [Capillimicrobium parvum]|uniref:Acyl-CoA dehydrogenase YdbM n=1 Tax=Capillimicrobium parvum TaxID=2884022 RepID=A0A9E6XY11_9ACTN|nr:acyl-CoA dehydrogenase family protein [Capillimicrobium parvum]UGS35901.1 Putative acyl-CoA dehydrogenase YdbM [Capillimicrobium parvum]